MQIFYSECKSIEKRFLNIFPDTKVKREIPRNIYATSIYEKKRENNSGLNGIRTHDLCDHTGAVLYQLSYQANWELVIV